MPTIDLGAGSPFRYVLVQGLRPRDPSSYQEALQRLADLGASPQIMDPRGLAGLGHIATAARLAAGSFKAGRNVARSPATELLLYASGGRQIKQAIATLGVGRRSRSWTVIAISDSEDCLRKCSEALHGYGVPDDWLMKLGPSKRRHLMGLYGISAQELALAEPLHSGRDSALKALVIERVAISELYR